MNKSNFETKDFRGYKQTIKPDFDKNLSLTDPNTPCGEYLRRYWHPSFFNF